MSKMRIKIKSELKNLNTDFDTRESLYKKPKTLLDLKKELKKAEKRLRDERKLAKFHLYKRNLLRKRWEFENPFTL